MSTIEIVKSIMSSKIDTSNLKNETLLSSLGLNSLDLVEITLEIEDSFNIDFTSNEITNLVTVKDVIDLIERKTK